MKISELIIALQVLLAEHGDLKVRLNDNEWGYSDEVHAEYAPDYKFISISQSPYFVEPIPTPEWVMNRCGIDHWAWNPEHVAERFGRVLTHAGVIDFDAWVAAERAKL